MERGDIVTVQIEDMSSEGQGIGRADGLVIFVPHTVVGDVIAKSPLETNYFSYRVIWLE